MKGLLIRKKWLDLILDGKKTMELFKGRVNIRGEIQLIESGTGLIKGVAEIASCSNRLNYAEMQFLSKCHRVPDNNEFFKTHRYGVRLINVYAHQEPIPYDHPHGAVRWVNL